MGDGERMLSRLGRMIDLVARPHRCDDALPDDLQTSLWQIGVPCDGLTSREELVVKLWARKRGLITAMRSEWGGPEEPSAA